MARINLGYQLEDQSATFEPMPAGSYFTKIIKAEVKKSSKGNDMISVQHEIISGEFAGRKVFDNIMLMVESAFKMKQYAEVVGVESGDEIDTSDFLNKECVVQLGQREYNGQMQNDVKRVSSVSAE